MAHLLNNTALFGLIAGESARDPGMPGNSAGDAARCHGRLAELIGKSWD